MWFTEMYNISYQIPIKMNLVFIQKIGTTNRINLIHYYINQQYLYT